MVKVQGKGRLAAKTSDGHEKGELERETEKNTQMIADLENEHKNERPFTDRLAKKVAAYFGSMTFV